MRYHSYLTEDGTFVTYFTSRNSCILDFVKFNSIWFNFFFHNFEMCEDIFFPNILLPLLTHARQFFWSLNSFRGMNFYFKTRKHRPTDGGPKNILRRALNPCSYCKIYLFWPKGKILQSMLSRELRDTLVI